MTTPPLVRTCATCKFFVTLDLPEFPAAGSCRKRAPGHNGFPPTSLALWCGEHKTAHAFLTPAA
jgi:hypothetical protein